MTSAFEPVRIPGATLSNRIALAPMTRSRAGEGGVATALVTEYYTQRASAGLLISEGIQPSAVGQGYPFTPGCTAPGRWRPGARSPTPCTRPVAGSSPS